MGVLAKMPTSESTRTSYVIDYMLSSQNMLDFVKSFNIEDTNILSDHVV